MSNSRLLMLLVLLVVVFFTFFTPFQLINSDSVAGFDALKGPEWTGKINTYFNYDQKHDQFVDYFLTWWSPGQYAMPGVLMKFTGLSLGHAVTLLNSLCLLFGTIGFALVFKKYEFSPAAIFLSVVMILFSGVLLSRYYSYQGGESLNFLLFPWILVLQGYLFRRYWNLLLPGLVLLVAFFFKSQMLIFVPPLLLLLDIANKKESDRLLTGELKRKDWLIAFWRLALRSIPVLFSIAWALVLIYIGFISKGATPASSNAHFDFKWLNVLVPLASPVTSIYAGEAGFNFFHSQRMQDLYLLGCGILVAAVWIFIFRQFSASGPLRKKYIVMVFSLFVFSVLLFTVLYSIGNVDYNTRHFKLTSFLLYPLVFDALLQGVNRRIVIVAALLLIVVAIGNHVRLTRTWLRDTQVTASGFRLLRTDMPLELKSRLDSLVTTRTIVVSPYESRYAIDNRLILPVELHLPRDTRHYRPMSTMGYPLIFVDSLSIYKYGAVR